MNEILQGVNEILPFVDWWLLLGCAGFIALVLLLGLLQSHLSRRQASGRNSGLVVVNYKELLPLLVGLVVIGLFLAFISYAFLTGRLVIGVTVDLMSAICLIVLTPVFACVAVLIVIYFCYAVYYLRMDSRLIVAYSGFGRRKVELIHVSRFKFEVYEGRAPLLNLPFVRVSLPIQQTTMHVFLAEKPSKEAFSVLVTAEQEASARTIAESAGVEIVD